MEPSNATISSIWANDSDLEAKVRAQRDLRAKASGRRLFLLAFSTLGIVYGDIGTSPLYVWASLFPEGAPVGTDGAVDERVVLGCASSIVWAITGIVLFKYVLLMLLADDNGEGGIFALYALICRAAGIQPGGGSLAHEADMSLTQYSGSRGGRDSGAGYRAAPASEPGTPLSAASATDPSGLRARWTEWRLRTATNARAALGRSRWARSLLLAVALVAGCMILSDGVLTPTISVVSAVEGIEYQVGISRNAVIGISCGILVALFALQPFGTQRVAFLFSPAVFMWLSFNGSVGIYNLVHYGAASLKALSPHYMYFFWSGRASSAWRQLGAVLLCVTGTEALYADMGHFSAAAIRASFLSLVYPSLIITYLGQTAMILKKPETSAAAYWESIPDPLRWPAVALATSAAVIASQALISGSFTIVQQAIALNAFPRLRVRHTSTTIIGQVYVSEVNWMLMLACVAVVAGFQTSVKIGLAYGLAVVTVMLLDTSLLTAVMVLNWEWSILSASAFWLLYNFVTGAIFSSTLEKVPTGAWFSLALTSALALLTWLWHWGQSLKRRYVRDHRRLLRDVLMVEGEAHGGAGALLALPAPEPASDAAGGEGIARISAVSSGTKSSSKSGGTAKSTQVLAPLRLADSGLPVARIPGLGIYYTELLLGIPPALERRLTLLPALHAVTVLLTVRWVPVPYVQPGERLLIRRLRLPGMYHVVARYGYMEAVDHGPAFISAVVQEIYEYLHPLPPSEGPGASLPRRPAFRGLGGDLEAGARVGPAATRVRVDAEDSLSSTIGRRLRRELSVQLVQLGATPATTSPGPNRPGSSHSAITVAVALQEGEEDADAGPLMAPAPWVQMPSVVRRVRAEMMGQEPPPPAALEIAQWQRRNALLAAAGAGDDATLSLPLLAVAPRPALALPADPTVSLPLPGAAARPALPPRPRASAAAADATLRPADAAQLADQLWGRLQQARALGAPPPSTRPAAAVASVAGSTDGGAAAAAAQQPRRLLFDVVADGSVGEGFPPPRDALAAEREALLRAQAQGVAYVVGRSALKAAPGSNWLKRWLVEGVYAPLASLARRSTAAFNIPRAGMLSVSVDYPV